MFSFRETLEREAAYCLADKRKICSDNQDPKKFIKKYMGYFISQISENDLRATADSGNYVVFKWYNNGERFLMKNKLMHPTLTINNVRFKMNKSMMNKKAISIKKKFIPILLDVETVGILPKERDQENITNWIDVNWFYRILKKNIKPIGDLQPICDDKNLLIYFEWDVSLNNLPIKIEDIDDDINSDTDDDYYYECDDDCYQSSSNGYKQVIL